MGLGPMNNKVEGNYKSCLLASKTVRLLKRHSDGSRSMAKV